MVAVSVLVQWMLKWWGSFKTVDVHSGPTPRGRVDSAARIDVERVLNSTSASTFLMLVFVVRVQIVANLCLSKSHAVLGEVSTLVNNEAWFRLLFRPYIAVRLGVSRG